MLLDLAVIDRFRRYCQIILSELRETPDNCRKSVIDSISQKCPEKIQRIEKTNFKIYKISTNKKRSQADVWNRFFPRQRTDRRRPAVGDLPEGRDCLPHLELAGVEDRGDDANLPSTLPFGYSLVRSCSALNLGVFHVFACL